MNKAVLFDRDGTLIEAVHYLNDPDKVVLQAGVVGALQSLRAAGYLLIVVTNQSGIGRGLIAQNDYEAVQERMLRLLAAHDIAIAAVYHCPHHPTEATGAYRRACDCRKPGTGMLEAAIRDHQLERSASFIVGDSVSDVQAGQGAGLRTILVRTGHGAATIEEAASIEADHIAEDVHDAVVSYILV